MSKRKLVKHIGSMSSAIFVSRIFGLIRDIVLMNYLGTTDVADAFQAGFRIPNLLRKLFGEGALSAAFIPIYTEVGIKKGKKEQLQFSYNMLSLLCLVLSILSLFGIFFAPILVKILAPGFDHQTHEITVTLTRILFPYLFLIGFSSILLSILNSHDFFFVPGLSSSFLNIGMLLVFFIVLWFNPQLSLIQKAHALSYGILFGGILQTIVNFPLLRKIGYKIRFYINFQSEALHTVWYKFLPGVIGLAIRQINLAVDTILASFLAAGSITALAMGNRLMQLPLGIIGVSAGVAVLPLFSKCVAEKNWKKLTEQLEFSLLSVAFILIPVTVLLIILGKEFIEILFLRGEFTQQSLQMTYSALIYYSLGIVFFSANRLLIPVFYANKDTKTPVKISAVTVVVNIVLNIFLMQFMQHAGLAFATSLSGAIQFLILYSILHKKFPEIKFSLTKDITKIIILSTSLLGSLLLIQKVSILQDHLWLRIVFVILYSIFFYSVGAQVLKIRYSQEIKKNLWKKFRKN